MKEGFSNKVSFVGAGIGLTLFAIFGLLPGAFLGGVLGLNMANFLFGSPLTPGLVPRILIAVGMLTGVMVTGLIFTVSGASLGWLAGKTAEALTTNRKKAAVKEKI